MQKWEYLVVYIQARETTQAVSELGMDSHLNADKFTEQLNKYASGGWELMHFEWDGDKGAKAVFKRPRG
ncbi:MAG: DUF4177 domain-containing protein [Anaerolineae bacterium]|nr:DUF4177 domain-containing protein [Anaerolineae bacterium]